VILTNDSLTRRNWNGDKKCCFCHFPENIQHLFIDCLYAKFLWRATHILFGISPPRNLDDLFNGWSKTGSKKYNSLLLATASALCWTVWLTINEVIFDKCRPKIFLQVFFRGTYWLRQWATLQWRDNIRDLLTLVGSQLETVVLQFFSSNGWLSTRRIGLF